VRKPAGDRPDPSGQGGVTFLEVMLGTLVGTMIAVPLLVWVLTALRSQETSVRSSDRANAQALLRGYLADDVAAARAVARTGTDCPGGESAGGTVVLSMLGAGVAGVRTNYVVAGVSGLDPVLWRRVCGTDGALADEVAIARKLVAPDGGWTQTVVCSARADVGPDECGQVEMTFRVDGAVAATVTASRRVGPPR